jgi:flagellar biosynthesis GTPase FlhF
MIRFNEEIEKELIDIKASKGICLEGNILKLIESDNPDFLQYISDCTSKDKDARLKRLEITKKIQHQNNELVKKEEETQRLMEELRDTLNSTEEQKIKIEEQNNELVSWKDENERISQNLKSALENAESARIEAESAKRLAETDLDILQKKTQAELIGTIVKVALLVIVSVGLITTTMYAIAMITNKDTQIIGSTWSNMFGILLTNAFSIVGTIMGVKYASEKSQGGSD